MRDSARGKEKETCTHKLTESENLGKNARNKYKYPWSIRIQYITHQFIQAYMLHISEGSCAFYGHVYCTNSIYLVSKSKIAG